MKSSRTILFAGMMIVLMLLLGGEADAKDMHTQSVILLKLDGTASKGTLDVVEDASVLYCRQRKGAVHDCIILYQDDEGTFRHQVEEITFKAAKKQEPKYVL